MNLVKKTLHGFGWVSLFSLTTKGVRFLTTLLLARLLDPEDFGLVAIGLLVVNTIAIFRDLGLGSALIYKKDNIEKAANTAFTLLPLVGLLLFGVTFLLSPYAAGFFNNAESEPVIKFLSISLLLISLGLTPSNLLDKELEFKRQFLPEAGSVIAYGIIATTLAFRGFGVWSIVYGKIFSDVVWLIVMWMVSPWRPKLEFDFEIARGMLAYGRHILGATFITFVLTNLDTAFVGRFLGTAALGFYSISYNVSHTPAMNITRPINRVMFPAYSKLQKNTKSLIRVYLKTLKYSSLVSVPVSLGILVIAPDLIVNVLGEKWMPALLPLQVLCIAGSLRSARASTGVLLNAVGRPEISEKLCLLQLILECIIIYPLSMKFGVFGTSVVVTSLVLVFTLVGFQAVEKLLKIGWKNYIEALSYPYLASFFMILAVYSCGLLIPDLGFIRLTLLIVVGGISYAVGLYVLNRELVQELRGLLYSAQS